MEELSVVTAVHHPVRRRIVDYLGLHGRSQVTTLARALEQQVGSISHHLRMLERAGVVERADDPTGDRRTSWWQPVRRTITWSAEDYADSPAQALVAREAERTNLRTQLQRLQAWHRRTADASEWARAAFSSDTLAWATPDELAALADALRETTERWRASIDLQDGRQRHPVFTFSYGFPTVP